MLNNPSYVWNSGQNGYYDYIDHDHNREENYGAINNVIMLSPLIFLVRHIGQSV